MKRTTATLGWLLAAALAAGAQEAPTASAPAVPANLAAVPASAAPGAAAPAGSPANGDLFAAIAAAELSPAELAAVFGDGFNLFVNRAKQTMTVLAYSGTSPTTDLNSIRSYSVPVTTVVVRNADASDSLPKNANVNTNKELAVANQAGYTYNPTQFPVGTYKIKTAGKPTDSRFGELQLYTNAAPCVPMKNATGQTGVFKDGGYNVHYTPFGNTDGCIGVRSQAHMNKIITDYRTLGAKGPTTLTVR